MTSNKQNTPSLFLPSVNRDISKEYIRIAFTKCGIVSRVEEKVDFKKERKLVFVHFESWNTLPKSDAFRRELECSSEPIRFYFREKEYWKVLLHHNNSNAVKEVKEVKEAFE